MKKKISAVVFFSVTGVALLIAIFLVAKYADLSQVSKLNFLKKQNQTNQLLPPYASGTYPYFSPSSTINIPKLEFNPNAKSYSIKFSEPYPISWSTKDSATVNLTGIELSNFTTDVYNYLTNSQGINYSEGQTVYALQLIVQVTTDAKSVCNVPLTVRMVENDNLKTSNISGNYLNLINCSPYNTLSDKKIIFVVPESKEDFTFTTGGNENSFFNIKKSKDGKLIFSKIDTPEKWKGATIGIDPSYNQAAPTTPSGFVWTEPSVPNFTIERGEIVEFKWKPGTYTGRVSFSISQTNSDGNYSHYQTVSEQLSKGSVTSEIKVPPGIYTITVSTPYKATARKIQLTVTGDSPVTDASNSKIFLSGSDSVISDGTCKTLLYVQTKDEYGYPVNDSSVSLVSNRSEDIITKNTSYTDYYSQGYNYFDFKSKSIGVSTLNAFYGNNQIPGKIIIKVIDSSENNCPENTVRYNNYEGM